MLYHRAAVAADREQLIKALVRFLRSLPEAITVSASSASSQATFQFPAINGSATPSPGALAIPVLNEMEQDILGALGIETMNGQELADKAGYPFESTFRLTLAAMRRRGLLGGKVGDRGYFAAKQTPKT